MSRRDDELAREIRTHLELDAEDRMDDGLCEVEARRRARVAFGGVALAHEDVRAVWVPRWLEDVQRDVVYTVRTLWRSKAFSVVTILTLALGIGATTAIFSVVNGVLLKPLPFQESERLVSLRQLSSRAPETNQGPATYFTYRENQTAFEAIGAWDPIEVSITGNGGNPERVQALSVSSATLPLLRVQPVVGRAFSVDDDTPGSPLRIVLTHGYWQRRFGGTKNIVGRSLVIDGKPGEVMGVLPSSFAFLDTHPDILLPMPLDTSAPRGVSFGFQGLARLKPGVTLAQANADVARMISLLPPAFAKWELQPDVRPLARDVIGDIGNTLWVLLAAVGIVLLIACANVANLLLVRAESRHQEFALRAALGASRSRMARALLSESVVLALAGGTAGVGLAQAATALLQATAPSALPRVDDIGIDLTVLLFTLFVSVLSGILFGLLAILRFRHPSSAALKEGGRSAGDAPGRRRIRDGLVVGQIALALTLLIVSGLMIRTFVAIRQVDPGFSLPEQIQTFVLAIPEGLVSDEHQAARTQERIAGQLAQVPGVMSVGLSSSITLDGEDNLNAIQVEGVPVLEGEPTPLRRFKSVGPGYFETMGTPLVAGRSITWSEIYNERPVIMVSESLARESWQEPSRAIGKRARATQSGAPWREIVGVVGDERDDGLTRPATAIVYWPILNESYRWRTMVYAVRSTRVGTPGFLRELERAVWSVNRDLPLANVQTLEEIQARSMTQTSFALVMLGTAAGVALLIGLVGIYGVIAYSATQRTREIGVRMALGARAAEIRTMFLSHGLSLTATGIVVGIGTAVVVTRIMTSFLFGVGPMDPITYAVVSAALTAVALLATYLPARRASRVDPLVALRADI